MKRRMIFLFMLVVITLSSSASYAGIDEWTQEGAFGPSYPRILQKDATTLYSVSSSGIFQGIIDTNGDISWDKVTETNEASIILPSYRSNHIIFRNKLFSYYDYLQVGTFTDSLHLIWRDQPINRDPRTHRDANIYGLIPYEDVLYVYTDGGLYKLSETLSGSFNVTLVSPITASFMPPLRVGERIQTLSFTEPNMIYVVRSDSSSVTLMRGHLSSGGNEISWSVVEQSGGDELPTSDPFDSIIKANGYLYLFMRYSGIYKGIMSDDRNTVTWTYQATPDHTLHPYDIYYSFAFLNDNEVVLNSNRVPLTKGLVSSTGDIVWQDDLLLLPHELNYTFVYAFVPTGRFLYISTLTGLYGSDISGENALIFESANGTDPQNLPSEESISVMEVVGNTIFSGARTSGLNVGDIGSDGHARWTNKMRLNSTTYLVDPTSIQHDDQFIYFIDGSALIQKYRYGNLSSSYRYCIPYTASFFSSYALLMDDTYFYVGTEKGVFRSPKRCSATSRWSSYNGSGSTSLPDTNVEGHYNHVVGISIYDNILYVASSSGVFRGIPSHDSIEWTHLRAPTTGDSGYTIFVNQIIKTPSSFVLATSEGLYTSPVTPDGSFVWSKYIPPPSSELPADARINSIYISDNTMYVGTDKGAFQSNISTSPLVFLHIDVGIGDYAALSIRRTVGEHPTTLIGTFARGLFMRTLGSGCGDFVLDHGEECDDGNNTDNDGCDSTCHQEPGRCGDGVVDGVEECDDGNPWDNDGCSHACIDETPPPPSASGGSSGSLGTGGNSGSGGNAMPTDTIENGSGGSTHTTSTGGSSGTGGRGGATDVTPNSTNTSQGNESGCSLILQ